MTFDAAATPDLWSTARTLLADAFAGGARAILGALNSITRRAIKRRLKALEAAAMKLLLVEAAKLDPPTNANAQAPAAPRSEKRAVSLSDPERPETWRVAFQLHIPPEAINANAGPRIRSLGPSRFVRAVVLDARAAASFRLRAAFRAGGQINERALAEKLARRFEALRRLLANPAPRARRLQRKLLALKQRAFDAAKRIALRRPPPRQLDPLFEERAAYAAWRITSAFARPAGSG
jgi:hypothetical protein